jgi:hypothetical protein
MMAKEWIVPLRSEGSNAGRLVRDLVIKEYRGKQLGYSQLAPVLGAPSREVHLLASAGAGDGQATLQPVVTQRVWPTK